MPCYHPLPAWRSRVWERGKKRGITFRLADGYKDKVLQLPCGKCIGCQLERSRLWAMRCMHEAMGHAENWFATLTYAEVPPGGSLRPDDFVKFMKRLRIKHEGVRFFQCGEYGEALQRPHHHAILFNVSFSDIRWYKGSGAEALYRSEELERLWSHGQVMLGSVTFESAGYVARYSLKKVTGPGADAHYCGRVPEYLTMSRRPGIGRAFIDTYRAQVYRMDSVVVRGRQCKPGRYYDSVQERAAPSVLEKVKMRRRVAAALDSENSGSRLLVREAVREGAVKFLKRGLEEA